MQSDGEPATRFELYVPAGQIVHVGGLATLEYMLPSGHFKETQSSDGPDKDESYVGPLRHLKPWLSSGSGVQTPNPAGLVVPGGHFVQLAAPIGA